MSATSITKKGEIRDGVTGAWVEFGTFVLNAASIAAAAQGIETAAISGAKVGDIVMVNPRAMEAKAAVVGAKVTAANEVSVYINNMYDSSTAVDLGSLTFDYIIIHLS